MVHYEGTRLSVGGPMSDYDVRLFCLAPEALPSHYKVVKVFNGHVWACVGLVVAAVSVLSVWASNLSREEEAGLAGPILRVLGSHVQQPGTKFSRFLDLTTGVP